MKTVGKLSYDHTKILGKGSKGTFVFGGFYENPTIIGIAVDDDNKSKKQVAIKRIQRTDFSGNDDIFTNHEVVLMQKAGDHPNILRYIWSEKDDIFIYIATELCRGTLEDFFNGKHNGLENKTIDEREILSQVTLGLAHLHKLGIVHRDLKPTNILIYEPSEGTEFKPQMKLADFDISKILETDKNDFTNTSVTNPNGTKGWMPPEVYKEDRIDKKVDVWALGCIFAYTICEGKHPFGENVDMRIDLIRNEKSMLVNRKDAKSPHKWDFQAFPLIKSMLRTDPSKRPTVKDVLNHPFFIPYEDREEYFKQLWSSFKDSVTSDHKEHFLNWLKNSRININLEDTPLHILCLYYEYENLIDLVTLLIEKGADVNAENANGENPLHLLCFKYQKDNMKAIIQLLIKNGADVSAKNAHGNTPLHFFCNNGCISNKNLNRTDIIQLLIENGADVNAVGLNENITLHLLFNNQYTKNDDLVDIVKLLIVKEVDVNAKNYRRDTPLHNLCYSYKNDNLIDIIQLLMQNKADVNTKNKKGRTPLHYLCEYYKNENTIKEKENLRILVGLFQRYGASIYEKDNKGRTPNDYLNRRKNSINMLPMEPTNPVDDLNNPFNNDETNRQKLFENICRLLMDDGIKTTSDDIAQLVELLRDDSIDVNVQSEYGYTPLNILCRYYKDDKLIDFVHQILILKGEDVNIVDKNGRTPLCNLCRYYNNANLIDLVQLLVTKGADVNVADKNGNTPLISLCGEYKNDNLKDIVQLLIDKGADVSVENEEGWTPLLLLCFNNINNNLMEIAQLMIISGAGVKTKNLYGWTSLHALCFHYNNENLLKIAQLLIENDADVAATNHDGDTPLSLLCGYYKKDNLIDIVQLLIMKGAKVNTKNKKGDTPLHYVCMKYNNDNVIDIIQLLLEKGAEVNSKNKEGETPLHQVCGNCNNENLIDIVQFLISKGAEINTVTKNGWTPLHLLCRYSEHGNLVDIVKFFLSKGEEVNGRDKYGQTLLHQVCGRAYYIARHKYFGDHDWRRNYKNDNLIDIAQFLIQNGADVNAKNEHGSTPLHFLCHYYETDDEIKREDYLKSLVILFQNYGASMDAKNNKGKTPCDYLIRQKRKKLCNWR